MKRLSWVRDYFILPLLVGLIIFSITNIIPIINAPKKEISYSIFPPEKLIDFGQFQDLDIQVNNESVLALSSARIRVWNSGNTSLRNVSVLVVFEEKLTNINVFGVYHSTVPEKEFGRIVQNQDDEYSLRFTYELLNPKDSDTITIISQNQSAFSFYAKQEELNVRLVDPSETSLPDYLPFFLAGMGIIASLLSSSLTNLLPANLKDFLSTPMGDIFRNKRRRKGR